MKWICGSFAIVVCGLLALADDKATPEGWKVYSPKDESFTILIPDQKVKMLEHERTSTHKGVAVKSVALSITGPKLNASIFTVSFAKLPKDATAAKRLEMSRDVVAKTLGGEIDDEAKIKLEEKWEGLEFQLKAGKDSSRVQIYDLDGVNLSLVVTGTKKQITGKSAEIFFGSFKPAKKEKP